MAELKGTTTIPVVVDDNGLTDRVTKLETQVNDIIKTLAATPSPTSTDNPPPPPITEPPPATDPPPVTEPPVSTAWDPKLEIRPVDATKVLCFRLWHDSSRYERFQRFVKIDKPTTLVIARFDISWASGGVRTDVPDNARLLVDGKDVNVLSSKNTFMFDPTPYTSGWHRLEFMLGEERSLPLWVWVGAAFKPDWVPVSHGSYEISHGEVYMEARVPAAATQLTFPLPARTPVPFADAISRTNLHLTMTVPQRHDNIRRLRQTQGVLHTYNMQSYFWSSLIGKSSATLPALDGPRGIGMVGQATHIHVAFNGDAIFCESRRVGRVDCVTGAVRTIAGERHNPWSDSEELAGDWSAVPEAERGFHEIWGLSFDPESVAVPPGTVFDPNHSPHTIDPTCLVTDSQNNRVMRLTFDKLSHATPAKVTKFCDGTDPWDVVVVDKIAYISERGADGIRMRDKDTGADLGWLVKYDGTAVLAKVDTSRFVSRVATLDVIRAAPICHPEGLFYQDGWLYYGSKANGQVRKINLTTKEVQVVCAPTIDGNSNFMKISLSDGTFGPRGTVFASTWSIAHNGFPQAFLPDGTGWGYAAGGYVDNGRAGPWSTRGYGTCSGVGVGRLYFSSSNEGLDCITQANSSDPVIDAARYTRGAKAYRAAGTHLLYSDGGFGFYDLPKLVSEDPDIAYYLSVAQG